MTFYQRRLPHWHPVGKILFITWRLYGSLPSGVFKESEMGKMFALADRYLDSVEEGPLWLKENQIAQQVCQTIQFGEQYLKLYKLYAFVVMANHVHLLIEPFVGLRKITRIIKGFTAREANKILSKKRKKFWQEESFDHWVRNESELRRIQRLELVLFSV